MYKILFIVALVVLSCSLAMSYAQDQDVDVVFVQLRNELLYSKVPLSDINSTTQVLKNLLNQGASKDDLVNMVIGIINKGFASQDLNIFLEFVSNLIESGAKVDEAAKVVLDGIDQGLAAGFKGGDLGLVDKVQEAVEEKKVQLLDEIKSKAHEKKQDQINNDLGSLTSAMTQ